MANFLGVLVLLALLAIPVGLVKPKVILWRSESPSRVKALAVSIVAFVLLVGIWGSFLPQPEKTAGAAAPVQPVANPVPKGIGVSQPDLAKIFNAAGYEVLRAPDQDGEPRWLGQNGLAMLEIRGDERNVRFLELRAVLVKGDEQSAKSHLITMAAAMIAIFPDWKEAGDWYASALKNGGQATYRGRHVAIGYPANVGFQFTVTAEP